MDAMNLTFLRASSLNHLHPFRADFREAYDQFSTLALKLPQEFPQALCDLVLMRWLIQVWTLDKYE